MWMQKRNSERSLANVRIAMNQEIEVWKDKYGRSNALAEQLRIDRQTMRKHYEEKLSKVPGRIVEVETVRLVTTDTLTLVEVQNDTVLVAQESEGATGKLFEASDEWSRFEVYNLGFAPAINYHVKDSVTMTTYSKRKWVFGAKEYFVQGTSHNPNTEIIGLESIKVAEQKRFSIGPYVGVGFNGRSFDPQIGVGVQLKIAEF